MPVKLKNLINGVLLFALVGFSAFTCGVEESPVDPSDLEIISFDLLSKNNGRLVEDVYGQIDHINNSITLTIPYGEEKTELYPSVKIHQGAMLTPSVDQPIDFSEPQTFTISLGSLSKSYLVKIGNLEEPSSKIFKFSLEKSKNSFLVSDLNGVVLDDSEHIYIAIPCGIDKTKFIPTIEISPGATISPASGVEQDFSGGVVYTVTSSLGQVTEYKITLSGHTIDKEILQEFFLANPESRLDWNIEAPMEAWSGVTLENCRVVEIYLTDKKIRKVPPSFGGLGELRQINFANNEIEELPGELGSLSKLTFINLNSNKLKSLPVEMGNLESITYMEFNLNNISEIPGTFGNLNTLHLLSMIHNQLTTVNSDFLSSNLSSLEYLRLGANTIENIPKEIGNLSSLVELNLTNNNLISIPSEIGDLKSLKLLHLAMNDIQSLPEEMGKLESLAYLDLGENQLTSLPLSFEKLANLEQLNGRNNKLTQFPTQLTSLRKVRSIRFSYNQINSIPEPVGTMKSLTSLWMNDNEITEVSEKLIELINLKYLSLLRNNLVSVPMEVCDLRKIGCQVQLDTGVECN